MGFVERQPLSMVDMLKKLLPLILHMLIFFVLVISKKNSYLPSSVKGLIDQSCPTLITELSSVLCGNLDG